MLRFQKYRLKWPITATQLINIDEMFNELFTDQKELSQTNGGYRYATPQVRDVVTMKDERRLLIDPAGTLSSLTIMLPTKPVDGQLFGVATTHIITVLTLIGSGGADVSSALPTALTAGQSFTAVYRSTNTTWYPSAA